MTVAKLEAFLNEHKISHEMKQFVMSVATVEMAAGAVHVSVDKMIKTVVLIDKKNELYVAITRGDDRVSLSRYGLHMKIDGTRMAKQDEVLQRTGFPVGGVPPLGFPAKFVVDVKVQEMPFCWAGGGSDKALVKLNPSDIIKATNAMVVKITV